MKFMKTILLLLATIFSHSVFADNDLFSFVKAFDKYLEPQGMKVLYYKPAVNEIKGYELTLEIKDPTLTMSYEPISNVYVNNSFTNALIVYKKEEINGKLNFSSKPELVSMFSKLFSKEFPEYYGDYPIFKKEKDSGFSEDISLYNNSQRSFIINDNKDFLMSADILFFNGETLSNYSKDRRNVDLYELKENVKNIYQKYPKLTFLPEKMDNMIVVFYSNNIKSSQNIFKNIKRYNDKNIGLLFLPYYGLQEDHSNTKDYQLFCQKDFSLTVDFSLLDMGDIKQDIKCPMETPEQIKTTKETLFELYKARSNIIDKFYIKEESQDKPLYYLYKQGVFIDHELPKELL